MKIHALASQPHYLEHLTSITKHLPDAVRGEVRRTRLIAKDLPSDDLVMIAGYADLALAGGRRTVLMEHGAGQRYEGISAKLKPFYGGPFKDNVIAYLGPRQAAVDSVGLPGCAIGSPICDPYELYAVEGVCAITWHWRARVICPEADTALPHYLDDLQRIVMVLHDNGWTVLGHRHPKLKGNLRLWSRLGIEEVDAETVRREAAMLISDNTSLAYEMAYLGRQNIVLNAPWYRRDVEHGLRFWENPPGFQVDGPEELMETIDSLDSCIPRTFSTRAAIAAYGKPMSDGFDGMRAAAWLTAFMAGL